MTDYPLVARETPVARTPSVVPLNLVYPGLSSAQIIAILWAHRWLSFLIVFAVGALTALLLTLWPRTYTAMATLMVNYEVKDPLNGKDLPVGQVASYIATQVELMQSPGVLLTVVDRLQLTQKDEYTSGYRSESGTLREWAANKLSKTLAVYQSQLGSQLIYVTYSATEPAEAAQVANMVAEVYKEQDHARSTGPPAERASRYAHQLSELKSKVDHAQKEVTAFHQRNSVIEGTKSNVDVILLTTLEERLLEAQNARRVFEARAPLDAAVSDQVLASNHVQALKTQLAAQELRVAHLKRTYTPSYPEIREAQAQLDDTRRLLASLLKSYSANVSTGLQAARRLEEKLQAAVAEHRAKVLTQVRVRDEAAKYVLELESAQTVYKRALDGYDQIIFASVGPYANVSFVTRAAPPVKASKPKLLSGLLLGGMAGMALGIGVPLALELFNRRVRCRDDLERHHGVQVLAEFGRLPMRVAP
jgi:uncharacterized protein involved in exopolysaccharide biosynthesis